MTSSPSASLEPLRYSIQVNCPVGHAFDIWTRRIDTWWPLADHSRGGEKSVSVVMEPHVGGRIYESTSDGLEHDWGEILEWTPPNRLVYTWHIYSDSNANATEVEVSFSGQENGTTLVSIEHRGWEHLAEGAVELRRNNITGWEDLLPHYVKACTTR